jgi:hypothetical protein
VIPTVTWRCATTKSPTGRFTVNCELADPMRSQAIRSRMRSLPRHGMCWVRVRRSGYAGRHAKNLKNKITLGGLGGVPAIPVRQLHDACKFISARHVVPARLSSASAPAELVRIATGGQSSPQQLRTGPWHRLFHPKPGPLAIEQLTRTGDRHGRTTKPRHDYLDIHRSLDDDLERQGIYPTAGVADAVACRAGLMLTKQIRETAQTWLEMQKAIDESIPS